MSHSRREFLCRAGAAALLGPAVGGVPRAGAEDREAVTLHARPGTVRLAPPDYPETPIWGYDGRVPGPTIRVRQGERVVRRFVNGLSEPSTVHWHGIRIENAMDGAPELTQPLVQSGAEFLYDFEPPDAGTWWYHSHHRAFEQMARGLYGALVVEERNPPEVDRDELLILDDWRLAEDASLHASFGALHDWAHAGRIGNWITVNGDAAWSREASRHERLRLRVLNAANARIFSLALKGLEGWVVALDGQPLPAPEAVAPFVLAPGQRVDLVVDVVADEGEEAFLVSRERDDSYALAAFPVRGSSREARLPAPAPLPPNPVPALGDLANARRETLRMDGGAMGRMREAVLGGRTVGGAGAGRAGQGLGVQRLRRDARRPVLHRGPRGDRASCDDQRHGVAARDAPARASLPSDRVRRHRRPPARHPAGGSGRVGRDRIRRRQPGRLAAPLPHAGALDQRDDDLVPRRLTGPRSRRHMRRRRSPPVRGFHRVAPLHAHWCSVNAAPWFRRSD